MPFNTKWYRENTRTIVFVFMALLLVVFLIQDNLQYLQSGRQTQNRTVGRSATFGTTMDTDRLQASATMQAICAAFGLRLGPAPLNQIDPVDYYLLREEARSLGIRVGRAEVQTLLRGDGTNKEIDTVINNIATQRNMSVGGVLDALADGLAVMKSFELQTLGQSSSIVRMKKRYRDQAEQAVLEVAVIDANELIDDVPEPSEDELQSFFEKYRDVAPPQTPAGDELAFGYRIPDRVKIEWTTLDPAQLKNVPIRSREVREHFERNAARYTKPAPTVDPSDTSSTTTIPMTFEEAEPRVRADMRELKAMQEAFKIVDGLRREANAPWAGADPGEDNYKKAPATQVSLADLHQKALAEQPGLSYQVLTLMTSDELGRVFGSSRPLLRVGQQFQFQLTDVAFRVQGLFKLERGDTMPALAVGEPSPLLMSQRYMQGQQLDYQPYFFRVLEVAPAAPPAGLADVRDAVVRDVKLSKAFALAKERAAALVEAARKDGLMAAVDAAADVRTMLGKPAAVEGAESQPALPSNVQRALDLFTVKQSTSRFTRNTPSIAGVGRLPNAADAVFALADEPGPHRAASFGAAGPRVWAVVELVEVKPAYEGDFALRKSGLIENQNFAIQSGLLDPANIRKRAGWQPAAGALAEDQQ